MIGDIPNDVTGTSKEVPWLNKLKAAVRANRIIASPGYKLRPGSDGTAILLDPSPGGKAGGSTMYKITALNGASGGADFFTARVWDGTTLGSADVLIAKFWHQRKSVASEVIDGVTVTYNHIDDNNRLANDGTNSENDVVYPRYVVGGIIWAEEPKNGTLLTGKTWMEIRPPRVWAKRYTA